MGKQQNLRLKKTTPKTHRGQSLRVTTTPARPINPFPVPDKPTPFEGKLGYTFHQRELVRVILNREITAFHRDFQRLEFLGDRVLALIVARWLLDHQRGGPGQLTWLFSRLVANGSLAYLAQTWGLVDAPQISVKVRADLVEATLGAICYDAPHDYLEIVTRILTPWLTLALAQALAEGIAAAYEGLPIQLPPGALD